MLGQLQLDGTAQAETCSMATYGTGQMLLNVLSEATAMMLIRIASAETRTIASKGYRVVQLCDIVVLANIVRPLHGNKEMILLIARTCICLDGNANRCTDLVPVPVPEPRVAQRSDERQVLLELLQLTAQLLGDFQGLALQLL